MIAASPPIDGDEWNRSLTVAIVGLGITQIIAWGSIYYALAVLGPSITRDLGWAPEWTYVGFSLALVIAGLCAPIAGRIIDQRGGRLVMSLGSVVAGAGLLLLAESTNWLAYLLAWSVLGVAKSMVLYEAAFATLAQASVANARRAITYLSFFGGFASTAFWPITVALQSSINWRGTFYVYAALAVFICLPIHWLALPAVPVRKAAVNPVTDAPADPPAAAVTSAFLVTASVLLSTSFALTAFMWSGISVHLLSMLGMFGFSSALAVTVGSLIGPAQVLGRVGDMLFGSRFHPMRVLMVSSSLLPIAFAVLVFGGASGWAAAVFTCLYGASIGMNTIARGAVPLALFGSRGFGARLGRIAAPSFIAEAMAPIAYALLISGYGPWAGVTLAAIAAVAAWFGVSILYVLWRCQPSSR